MVKVIVADIDNTLVSHRKEMTDPTKESIRKLNERGIIFGIASGRPFCQVKPLIDNWDIKVDFVISANGCELYDLNDGTVKTYFMMKPEWFKEIIELMKPFNGNPMMVIDGRQCALYEDDDIKESGRYIKIAPRIVDDIHEFYIENSKIMFRLSEEDMKKCEEFVSKLKSDNYKGFKTQPFLMEFSNINASKAYSLKQYCYKKGVDLKDVWAFGDTSNDNDMLIAAGKGICMLNGSDDTKAIADEITEKPCCDDGFAFYINNKIFGE